MKTNLLVIGNYLPRFDLKDINLRIAAVDYVGTEFPHPSVVQRYYVYSDERVAQLARMMLPPNQLEIVTPDWKRYRRQAGIICAKNLLDRLSKVDCPLMAAFHLSDKISPAAMFILDQLKEADVPWFPFQFYVTWKEGIQNSKESVTPHSFS
jgi:hypothetical protein